MAFVASRFRRLKETSWSGVPVKTVHKSGAIVAECVCNWREGPVWRKNIFYPCHASATCPCNTLYCVTCSPQTSKWHFYSHLSNSPLKTRRIKSYLFLLYIYKTIHNDTWLRNRESNPSFKNVPLLRTIYLHGFITLISSNVYHSMESFICLIFSKIITLWIRSISQIIVLL